MVLVLGKGISGTSAAILLDILGIEHLLCQTEEIDTNFDFCQVEYVVISPGIKPAIPLVNKLNNLKIPIISEVELAYRYSDAPIIAITGTNGKSTVTSLVHKILCKGGLNSRLLGNIGIPFCSVALSLNRSDIVALEISSFQLNSIASFRPHIGCILNIAPDHLDYHASMEDYVRAKLRITVNQTEDDYLVLSADAIACEYMKMLDTRAKVVFFSMEKRVNGAYLLGGKIYFDDEYILDATETSLIGEHNIQNILAAVAIAKIRGIDNLDIVGAIREFAPLKHRLQFVRKFEGKSYFNDSKATNIESTICDSKAFETPTVLLLGGSDKGEKFANLFKRLPKSIVGVVTYGSTAGKIAECSQVVPTIRVNTLKEALEVAKTIECDNILLAPACASFDQYANYEERGEDFIAIVNGWQ